MFNWVAPPWPTTGKCSGRQFSLVDKHRRASIAILLDINRRQLLTSTATVAVAGIAPKVAQSKALAKSEITQQPTTEAPPVIEASNFHNITILRIRQIAERNRIRQEAGLPLLPVPKELRRMKETADTEQFRKFADAHRKMVYDSMLALVRRRCGAPDWAPTGVLSGGALWFFAQVQMRKLYRLRNAERSCPTGNRPAAQSPRVR
jgi:hypothetical protein